MSKLDPRSWKAKFSNKSYRDNYLRAVEFRNPSWIPCSMSIFPAVWAKYKKKLLDIVKEYPFIFGTLIKYKKNFDKIPFHHQAGVTYVDNWGCTWHVAKGGFEGQVVGNPIDDWSKFETHEFPDPLKKTETGSRGRFYWGLARFFARIGKRAGYLVSGSAERLFDRLYFLRGFDNLMQDFAMNHPLLPKLVKKLEDHEMKLVKAWLKVGVDIVGFHTDIGMQDRLIISPRQFRKYIKPMFKTLFQACRAGGAHVYLSSDGYLLDIVDDLVECGVSVHDPQLRANTLEGIKRAYKGKMCVDLDLDRQSFPFDSPGELKEQVAKSVELLSAPEGGLMMKAEISDPNVPLKNIKALLDSFMEHCILD
ncbi:MAG: uroporphyrinogen decarboxylase family protein [Promethearchaeota archaeon]